MLSVATRAERAIENRVFPGCVIGSVRRNGEREVLPFGNLRYEDSPAVEAEFIYDVASLTKAIPTASLALLFIDRGKLKLTGKLIDYVPEYSSSYREAVTIEHLLTYTVGGPQLSLLKDKTPDEILQSAYSYECANKPGSTFTYSNAPALLLGLAVERAGGKTLDALAQEYFFGPLKMNNTTFFPMRNRAIYRPIVPTEIVDGKEICGIVHDESARVFARTGRAVGHAGLFSTALDILNFLEALLQGEYPAIVDGAQKGWGWELNQPFMGKYAGPHTFGKTGFTGTSCMCDTEKGVALVILSNRTYPVRPKDRSPIDAFRADIADLVLS